MARVAPGGGFDRGHRGEDEMVPAGAADDLHPDGEPDAPGVGGDQCGQAPVTGGGASAVLAGLHGRDRDDPRRVAEQG